MTVLSHSATASTVPQPQGWRRVLAERISYRILGMSLVLGFLLGTLLVVVAWNSFGVAELAPPKDVVLTIPAGTAAAIKAGLPTKTPSEVRLISGDKLVLDNQDVVAHTIGGWTIQPGTVLTVLAETAAVNVFSCTIHPSGSLGLLITARPGLIDAILVTFLVSVPISLVLFAGWTVFRMLETDDPEYERAA